MQKKRWRHHWRGTLIDHLVSLFCFSSSVAPATEKTLYILWWQMHLNHLERHWQMKGSTTEAGIGAWLRSAGALFARSSWRRMTRHAEESMQAKNWSLKMSCANDGRGTLSDTLLCVLPVCWVSVNEMAIVAGEMRSNLLEQENGATFSGVIWLSVRLNQADKAELISGPAGPCPLIIYWYAQRVILCTRTQYYTELIGNGSWEV